MQLEPRITVLQRLLRRFSLVFGFRRFAHFDVITPTRAADRQTRTDRQTASEDDDDDDDESKGSCRINTIGHPHPPI